MNKLYLNPAYAGMNRDLQLSAISRFQWTGVPSVTQSSFASIDIACPKNRLGFALNFFDDVAGEGILRTSYGGFTLATHLPARFGRGFPNRNMRGRKYIISFGLKYQAGQKSIDWSKLVTSDQLDAVAGRVYPGALEGLNATSDIIHDLAGGFVFRGELNKRGSFISAGLGVSHLNRPIESILGTEARIPLRYTAHLYTNFRISKKFRNTTPIFLTVGGMHDVQQTLNSTTLGGSFTLGAHILVGVWFRNERFLLLNRNTDAILLNLIYSTKNLSIGYSYDVTTSTLGLTKSNGTHEVGISYRFENIYLCKRGRRGTPSDKACFLIEPKYMDKSEVVNFLP
jgi:type IX secretion system PorP/SprF family membrane protein